MAARLGARGEPGKLNDESRFLTGKLHHVQESSFKDEPPK